MRQNCGNWGQKKSQIFNLPIVGAIRELFELLTFGCFDWLTFESKLESRFLWQLTFANYFCTEIAMTNYRNSEKKFIIASQMQDLVAITKWLFVTIYLYFFLIWLVQKIT